MAKTLAISSQVLVSGFRPHSDTSSGPTSLIEGYDSSAPTRPLSIPKFFPFNIHSNFNQRKLLKPFRLKAASTGVMSSVIDTDVSRYKRMLGGFYRMNRDFSEREVEQELGLLSQQTRLVIRPGSTSEFLQFFRDRNFTNKEIPEISVILGNLLFRVIFTRIPFELEVAQIGEKLDHHIQIFCVQEI